MRKVIVLFALALSLFLSACASPPKTIIVVVTATPEAGSGVFQPSPTIARPTPTQVRPTATKIYGWRPSGGTVRPTPTQVRPTATRSDTTDWDRASLYIGEFKTVCGPVISTRYASSSNGQPTFLNIGRAYPDPDRFTVVIWGRNRGNFSFKPEDYYRGKTICVSGLIEEYRGVPEIEVSSPSQIEIQ